MTTRMCGDRAASGGDPWVRFLFEIEKIHGRPNARSVESHTIYTMKNAKAIESRACIDSKMQRGAHASMESRATTGKLLLIP